MVSFQFVWIIRGKGIERISTGNKSIGKQLWECVQDVGDVVEANWHLFI